MSAQIERSAGIPATVGGVCYGFAGGGYQGASQELDETVQRAAEMLAGAYDMPVTIRFNSDRMSGGAWLRTHEVDGLGANSEIGLCAQLVTAESETSRQKSCERWGDEYKPRDLGVYVCAHIAATSIRPGVDILQDDERYYHRQHDSLEDALTFVLENGSIQPRRGPFVFNGDYHDLNQVIAWLDEFSAIRDEITSAGGYPYNDCFIDRIPGIANKEHHGRNSGTHEDAAIYLLQKLYRARENAARIKAALDDGCFRIETLSGIEKFSRVIVYDDQDRMRGPIWEEWQDARLVPTGESRGGDSARPYAVLPKGKRTSGHLVNGRKVMAKR